LPQGAGAIERIQIGERNLRVLLSVEGDLGKLSQKDVIRYFERHARDRSPKSGKAMCWSLRSFSDTSMLRG
jgi:hypothetical protein